jgi:RNA polymerase-binding transcription factor DksA
LLRLLAFDEMRLNQVRHAVEWHENGHRGLCEDCRRPIDPARLEAIPCATRCVLCQEKWERSAKRRRSYW